MLELGAGGIVVESEHSNMLKTWTLAGVRQDDDVRGIQSKSPAPALVNRACIVHLRPTHTIIL